MEKIGEGGQCTVYKLNEQGVFRHYKLDSKYPVDFSAIEIMCNEIEGLKRVITPVKIDYSISKDKIVGTYSQYVKPQQIQLGDILCSVLYQWYLELCEDAKILSSKKIRMMDSVSWNYVMNTSGPYLTDVYSFKFCPEKTVADIERENIEDLNNTFLYGFIWKVGQFVIKQPIEEILGEIANFNGTLYEYLSLKNPYDYGSLSDQGIRK